MPRTRVHSLSISLDGYAAGEHVTFDAPIGGAERLFTWFDGRAIHGVDKVDAPFTLDRALTSMGPGNRRRDHGASQVRPAGWRLARRRVAGLVGRRTTDFMHLVIVPITLGRGVSLWEGSSGAEDGFTVESVTSPSGLTHQLWNNNDHL